MRSKLSILGICAGALVVVAAGAAYAHGGFGRGGPGFMERMIEKRIANAEDYVEATPEQRKVIDAARDSISTKMKAHFEARRAARQAGGQNGAPTDPHDMIRLLAADKIDEAAIYAAIDARAEEMKSMAREIVPEVIKAHDALTPAQRQKLAARAEERRSEMQKRWHGAPPDDERGGFGGPDQQQ
jgi:Spy/CpxP family protein refolding chaperone